MLRSPGWPATASKRPAGSSGRAGPAASPPPPTIGKPFTASTTSPTPSATCTTSATTRTRTDSPPERSVVCRHRLEDVGEAPARLLAARRDVLRRHAVGRRLVAAQDLPRDGLAVDLVRPVVEARRARVAVHRLERQVGRVAECAVDLQRPVDDVVHDGRAVELDQR